MSLLFLDKLEVSLALFLKLSSLYFFIRQDLVLVFLILTENFILLVKYLTERLGWDSQ